MTEKRYTLGRAFIYAVDRHLTKRFKRVVVFNVLLTLFTFTLFKYISCNFSDMIQDPFLKGWVMVLALTSVISGVILALSLLFFVVLTMAQTVSNLLYYGSLYETRFGKVIMWFRKDGL